MSGPIYGRDAELSALGELWDAAARGMTGAALILGESGMGKSRLLDELRLRTTSARRLELRGYEPERSIAFAAVRDALISLAVDPAGLDGGQARIDIFEAAYRALPAEPLLILVDDVHWFDETSVALCHYVLRAAAGEQRPLCVVAAGRSSARWRELDRGLGRLDVRRLRVDLRPLGRTDGIELVRHLDPSCPADAAEQLWLQAAGSPFWIAQLVTADAGGPAHEQLSTLSDDEAMVVSLLVAAARPLARESVAEALGVREDAVAESVAALVDLGLVTEDTGGVWLAHDLIRASAAERIPAERLRRMHGRLAAWLEAGPDDAQRLMEALHHRRAAGLPMLETAIRLAEADQRRRIGIGGLAILAEVADAADGMEANQLTELVAALAMDLGEHEQALGRWSRLIESAGGEAAARFALGGARAALELNRADEATGLVQRARAAVAAPRLDLQVELEATASAVERWFHHSDSAAAAADRAVTGARALADAAGGPEHLAPQARRAYLEALRSAADAALIADDPPRMLALADEAATVAAGHDDRSHLRALTQRALALRFMGRNADAETSLRRAWDEARSRVLPQAILEIGSLRGTVLLALGRVDDARQVTRECLELGQRLQELGPSRVFSLTVPGLLAVASGEWQRGVDLLAAAAEGAAEPHYRLHARALSGQWSSPG